ncbi:tRNA (adenosine(37)-N6)-dimethylallyltransferase MiaA [Sphingobacterium sp. LRF_L2]|uniref:tRNA (adenosine(37)-N6)-dimethylallyltransferase MiaA n=1 Tax=Sphingobacterium sp. LRF_L2 TaxID=3369421 RepID=UPI003F5F226F
MERLTPPDLLYIILGPTASGKTQLGVALAERISGEIISVDSRQVYRGMNIGTGKDLEEYKRIPYHLIDIREPGEKYDITQFLTDFKQSYTDILARGRQPIAVGGTGMYIHSLLKPQPYMHVPVDKDLRDNLQWREKDDLIGLLTQFEIPTNFHIDTSSHKRLIRAIEILKLLEQGYRIDESASNYQPILFGLSPSVETRRTKISNRLTQRIRSGLLQEVEQLISSGVSHEDLQYYGLEYKYSSLFILGELDKASFYSKLETEIHRYAKRQMTFFRKMEKDGLKINWLKGENTADRLEEIIQLMNA